MAWPRCEDFGIKMSLADFLVIAAEGVMNITRENVLKVDPQRQALDFRSRFKQENNCV